MTEVKLGIVGLGNWGDRLAGAVARIEGASVEMCFARSLESRSRFSKAHGCEPARSMDALVAAPLDGILVATPHSTHRDVVGQLAVAGRNIMVEKPLALSVSDARACVRAADEAGIILQVAHYRRRLGATRALRRAIDDGRLGTVHALDGWFSRVWGPQADRPWRDDPDESPLGGMTALGVHIVDNFHYLAGPISRVSCFSKQIEGVTGIDDITTAMFEFESGPVGRLGTSLRVPFHATTAVFGSEASAWSSDDGTRFLVQNRDDREAHAEDVEPVDGVVANLTAFCESLRTGSRPETGGREGFAVVAVMDAMRRSAVAGGAVVEVESF